MTTWREAIAAKNERLLRERRFFTPDLLGKACPVCGRKMPKVLLEEGMRDHPTCGPEWRSLSRDRQ